MKHNTSLQSLRIFKRERLFDKLKKFSNKKL